MTNPHIATSIALAFTALLSARALAAAAPSTQTSAKRIVIIGDSTVCEYPEAKPERGWGHYIEGYFRDGTVKVINLAAAGRSTKTFITEGRWKKALAEKPDYVLIQFGHNDSHASTNPEATKASADYKEYLRQYIDESRAIGATPILVTPMVRRTFDLTGKLIENASDGSVPLGAYADAMKDIGKEKNVPVIDLHASSFELVQKLGLEASLALANKKGDNTHFNEKGARAMADLVMKELPTAAPSLKDSLKAQ